MLIVRRRAGEAILVGDVEIEIIEISRSRVKLGVRAPYRVPVVRKETLTVARENAMAAELVGSRGQEGVGELLEMICRSDAPQDARGEGFEDGSTKPDVRRYETPDRYSRYRSSRENPHPA